MADLTVRIAAWRERIASDEPGQPPTPEQVLAMLDVADAALSMHWQNRTERLDSALNALEDAL